MKTTRAKNLIIAFRRAGEFKAGETGKEISSL